MGIFEDMTPPEIAVEDNTDRHFPGQNKNEELLLYTRLHPIILLPHLMGFVASLIVFPMIVYALESMEVEEGSILTSAIFLFLFITYAYYFHKFFLKIFNYYLSVIILTNFRIIQLKKSVFLYNSKDTIDLHKIQDLRKDQNGLLSTLFDYGTVTIEVSAIHETKQLKYIPRPEQCFQVLNKAKRKYIDKRREKKVSIDGGDIAGKHTIKDELKIVRRGLTSPL
ncbi:MAG: hypothetical protein Q8P68_01215 [Candidatus Peregrinibacteria bacterium]|nr:hypothetical protein [Candidatus Peregrinibacteria bacterium]